MAPSPVDTQTTYVCVCVCVCVCVFIKLHITAQSGPVILVILCHSHWSSQGGINDTCYENLWSVCVTIASPSPPLARTGCLLPRFRGTTCVSSGSCRRRESRSRKRLTPLELWSTWTACWLTTVSVTSTFSCWRFRAFRVERWSACIPVKTSATGDLRYFPRTETIRSRLWIDKVRYNECDVRELFHHVLHYTNFCYLIVNVDYTGKTSSGGTTRVESNRHDRRLWPLWATPGTKRFPIGLRIDAWAPTPFSIFHVSLADSAATAPTDRRLILRRSFWGLERGVTIRALSIRYAPRPCDPVTFRQSQDRPSETAMSRYLVQYVLFPFLWSFVATRAR